KKIEQTGEDLLAVALCHEIDHLNGELFDDKIIKQD
ncbi:MAG: peptide deformylase, partial [Firmicutes bacterium]|nr:peptide deformylase [Bacillota bacterium]